MHDEMKIPKDFENSLAPWIGKTEKMMSLFLKDTFAAHGTEMTREQFILLKKLYDQDGLMQKDLAFITDRNKGSLARLVSTMEKKNLVARITDKEDKRVNRIFLTANGRKVFENMLPVLRRCMDQVQKDLSTEEIQNTIAVLKKIQQNLGLKI